MDQTIMTSLAPQVFIDQVQGDLLVKGWERPEIGVKASPEDLVLEGRDEVFHLSCRSDCTVRLPFRSSLHVNQVAGDAHIQLLENRLTIEQIRGSLVLNNVSDVQVKVIHGNLVCRHIQGGFHVESASGNIGLQDVQGNCIMDRVSGNLDVSDVEGEIKAVVGGNARLRLSNLAGDNFQIQADGNVNCRVPQDASLRLKLTSSAEVIKLRLPEETRTIHSRNLDLTLKDGRGVMTISSGGYITLTAQEPDGSDSLEQDAAWGDDLESLLREESKQNIERITERAQAKILRTQEKLERKLEATRRRSEMKALAAQRRAQGRSRQSWRFEWSQPFTEAASEPPSEEERLLILRMLEHKKITVMEAEQLLAALEGKSE
jgi:hypothetical protein